VSDLRPLAPLLSWFPKETDDVYALLGKTVAWIAVLGVALYASFTLGTHVIVGDAVPTLRHARDRAAAILTKSRDGTASREEVESELEEIARHANNGVRRIFGGQR
jgi:hypothetical protein